MYGHPPQGGQNQKVRYSTQPQQSFPGYQQPVMSNSQYNPQNAYHQAASHSQAQHYQMSGGEMYNQNAMRNPSQSSNYGQQQFTNANAALIQPPALNVEENIDTNSQLFPPRQPKPMTISNNENSEFDNIHHQQEDPMWANEAQIASMFWEQRCMTMLERFQWFYQRFQILRGEYITLSDQMQKMDSQQQWHNFQQHHDQFHQKIVQMQQELSAVLGQNQQLMQQKQVQEGQSVWQQRYQQLLGNFKSLQEEMSQMEPGGGGAVNGVPPEQYQHLQDQFGELQYQYGQVVNELQHYRGADIQINQYLQQIENYKQKMDGLHNQNVEMQQMILELSEKNKILEEGYQNSVDPQKYQELAYLLQQKQKEIQQLQQDYKVKSINQASINQYQSAMATKNGQIEVLKQKLSDKDKEISLGIIKLQSVEGSLRNNLHSEFQGERLEMEKKIAQLQRTIDDMKRQSVRLSNHLNKVEILERKVQSLNHQISTLNDTLKKKNQELSQLRNANYQLDRLKQNQSNFNKVLQQKAKLSQLVKKKNAEIQGMHIQVEKLSVKIQQVSNKKQQYSTRNLMLEIQDLTDQLRRYEGEINKLKNIIQLKEQYSQNLQAQVRQINQKYISAQQILLNQREDWKEKEIKLSSKNLDHQKRIKNLDYEFNLQLKQNLQKQVISLRKQNVQKQQAIRALQEKELLLASQIAVFQKLKNNFDRDISLLRKKQKELQSLNEAQTRRFKELQSAYLAKENDLDQMKMSQISLSAQLSTLKNQIQQCNSLIKTKNRTIQNLQSQLKQQLGRTQLVDELMNQNGKLKIGLKATLEQLQKWKFSGQSRMGNSKVLSPVQSRKQLEKEQRNLIGQLQQQNGYLKVEISKLLEKRAPPHESVPISPQSKLVTVDLNKRLNQFNSKLHFAISEPKETLNQSKSQKLIELWQNQRKQLIQKYEQEISKLKQQMTQRQSNRILVTQKTDQSNYSESPRKQAYSHLESEQLRQEILFFRQKYKQQEERNQTLVKINEELKSKVENALKFRQGVNASDYYKQQIKLLENENQLLKGKSKKLMQQNKECKIELSSKNSKLSKDYELKILQLQLSIQQQKRKISYLNAQKASANNQRASMQHNYNISSLDRQIYQPKSYKPSQSYKATQSYKPSQSYKPLQSYKASQKYQYYLPQSPKNIQQQFQSVLGNLRGNQSPKNNIQSYGPISQISSNTYGDSRVNQNRRLQK